MSPSFLESVLRGAEAFAGRDPVGLLPDAELLKRFTTDRDPVAFTVLVRRHGPLVWGVCRNLLLEDSEAEDAFQATFLALVKSASSVNRPEALGGWLHGVAYRVAMRARRSAARRKKRESVAASSEASNPVADGAWDELQAAVHEEVCRLPEKLRLPFVLVGLQGRPQKEAAKQLGWALGTFSARLCQARQRLLDRLAKRNIPVGMAAGATALGVVSASAAVPTALVMKAFNVVAAPDAVTPFVISLSRGVTQMYLTRTKILVAAVLVAGVLTTGIGGHLMSNADAQSPETIAEVERKLEALREQQAKGKWEYKFVPFETPLPAKELQRVLAGYDREGWEYCGSQDIDMKGKAVAHLTFKRPNKASTATTEREQLLLEALKTYEEALKMDLKKGAKKPTTPEEQEKFYLRALQTQYDAAAALKQKSDVAQKVEAEARQRAEIELKRAKEAEARARLQAAEAVDAEARARLQAAEADLVAKAASLGERDRAAQLQKQLEVLKAEHAALLKLPESQKKAGEKGPAGEPNKLSIASLIPLKHVTAQEAAQMLQKISPELKATVIVDPERTNSIGIRATPDIVAKIQDLIAKTIDVKPVAPPGKNVTVLVPLKNVDVKLAAAILEKVLPGMVVAQAQKDVISLTGSQNAIEEAKRLIAVLEKEKTNEPDKQVTVELTLKHLTFGQAQTVWLKLQEDSKVQFSMDPRTIYLSGPNDAVVKAKKVLEDLDAAAGKPK